MIMDALVEQLELKLREWKPEVAECTFFQVSTLPNLLNSDRLKVVEEPETFLELALSIGEQDLSVQGSDPEQDSWEHHYPRVIPGKD
jgi:hypothetical protein